MKADMEIIATSASTSWPEEGVWQKAHNLSKNLLKPLRSSELVHKTVQGMKMAMRNPTVIQFHLPVDFKTLPVDCQNFIAQRAAMLVCLLVTVCFCGEKTMRANFKDHVDKIVCLE